MKNTTQLKRGSLNGLYRQTNECLDSAYSKGFEDGNKIADKDLKEIQDSTYDVAYNKGVVDFENLFVHEHDYEQFFEATYGSKNPDYNLYDLVAKYGAKKVLDDFKKWQEEKKKADEEIIVGDEIKSAYSEIFGVVTNVSITGHIRALFSDGTGATIDLDPRNFKKTGRHFDEVEKILDKLRGENND